MKRKLFLDFDSVIVDSIHAICQVYNMLYKDHPQFTPAKWYNCTRWDMKDVCPLVNNILDLFEHPLFFQVVNFMNPNTKEVIEKLCKKYQVIVCSLGTPLNLSQKAVWLKNNLPCIKDYILLSNGVNKMSKSIVNMDGAIQIDDVASNLATNASYKIIFGDEYEWNKDCEFTRCYNFTDIENLLL